MQQPHLIKASHIMPFLEGMRTIGMPISSMMNQQKLDEEWFHNDNQLISEIKVWELIDAPKRIEGVDDFGFWVTQRNELQNYGEFGRSLTHASSVFEALQLFINNMRTQTTAPQFWIESKDDYLWFCREGIKGVLKGNDIVEQHVLGLMVQTVRLGSSKLWSPPEVDVQAYNLCNHTRCNFITDSKINVGRGRTAIAIPKSLLLTPIQSSPNANLTTLVPIAESLSSLISDIVSSSSSTNRFALQSISAQLEIHPRQIQRQLKRENTSFRQISNQIRISEAKKLLAESDLTIIDISNELGYTDQANFWRAFIKSTGLSPTEYRNHV